MLKTKMLNTCVTIRCVHTEIVLVSQKEIQHTILRSPIKTSADRNFSCWVNVSANVCTCMRWVNNFLCVQTTKYILAMLKYPYQRRVRASIYLHFWEFSIHLFFTVWKDIPQILLLQDPYLFVLPSLYSSVAY